MAAGLTSFFRKLLGGRPEAPKETVPLFKETLPLFEAPPPAKADPKKDLYEFAIVCCARWETPYIGEWIKYYDALGFDRIYLYCNDDDPVQFMAEVDRTPKSRHDLVDVVHFVGQGMQRAMYVHALERVRREARWVTFLDVDEFLVLREGNNIKKFMTPRQDFADSIYFNWLNFGNSGFVHRPPGSVLIQYTWRDANLHENTKHITRVSCLDTAHIDAAPHPFWHGLFGAVWDDLRRVTVLGDDIAQLMLGVPLRLQDYLNDPDRKQRILGVAVINHYVMKSEDDFVLRATRGLGGEFAGQKVWQEEYENGNYKNILGWMNQVEDTTLRDFAIEQGFDVGYSSADFADSANVSMIGETPSTIVSTLPVHHSLWVGELELGENGRARHTTHGSLASYRLADDILYVKWDDWPAETFVKRGEKFVLLPVGQPSEATAHQPDEINS